MTTRPDWDEVWLQLAVLMGQRSRCASKAGAVIVSAQQRVISTGYAGPPAHFARAQVLPPDASCTEYCMRPNTAEANRDPGYRDCVSSHAEANAIIMADRSLSDSGAFYVSTVPCFSCAKMIANTGVAFVMWVDDGKREPGKVINFLKLCGIPSYQHPVAVRPENSQ